MLGIVAYCWHSSLLTLLAAELEMLAWRAVYQAMALYLAQLPPLQPQLLEPLKPLRLACVSLMFGCHLVVSAECPAQEAPRETL